MKKVTFSLKEIREELLSLFDYKAEKELKDKINELLEVYSDEKDNYEFWDIIGEMTRKNPEYFIKKIYSDTKLRGVPIEVDKYILRKHCFLEGEEIIDETGVFLKEKSREIWGTLYLTNYRIIVAGMSLTRMKSLIMPSFFNFLVSKAGQAYRKSLRDKIEGAIIEDMKSHELGEWGYTYPIHNTKNIVIGSRNISYTYILNTEKKKFKSRVMISPNKKEEESKEDFKKRRQRVLTNIQQTLVKLQQNT
ncbi:MAG: hypothetical protein ACFE8B_15785 [Candidatus Hermodarchaeota archaeon]